mmetsp:Transcript_28174/g.59499  ORF Transcript_28174/g.59499 Transcript_28174/m.59499 type:complete len:404 (-) Transcript_28174:384-1595(-)
MRKGMDHPPTSPGKQINLQSYMIRQTARTLSNKMLILSEADVRRCFPVSAAIAANRKALGSLRNNGDGGAMVPTRIGLPYYASSNRDGDSGGAADWSLFKPAAYYPPKQSNDDEILMGMKLVSVRANNPAINKPTVPATIMLVNAETGEVSAIVAATYLTAARTSAGSALATEMALVNNDKRIDGLTLVVFGAGLQSELHIKCIMHVVNITKLVIVNRSHERAEKLKEILLGEQPEPGSKTQTPINDISIRLLSDKDGLREAVANADVIATTTNTCTPLFDGEWLKPGCHINGVGSYTPLMQEVDEALVKRCEVLIDTKESLDVGDLSCLTVKGDAMPSNYVGLIGDALSGNITLGTQRDDKSNNKIDCTFFKSTGTAIQDVVSAHMVVEAAKREHIGTQVAM